MYEEPPIRINDDKRDEPATISVDATGPMTTWEALRLAQKLGTIARLAIALEAFNLFLQ